MDAWKHLLGATGLLYAGIGCLGLWIDLGISWIEILLLYGVGFLLVESTAPNIDCDKLEEIVEVEVVETREVRLEVVDE